MAEFSSEFKLKRLASEKVIRLWVGVRSLIFCYLKMGAIGFDGICVFLNGMSRSSISLKNWKNHKCR